MSRIRRILPSHTQLGGLIFVTLLLVLLGSSRQLINYYGLSSSTNIIATKASESVTQGLNKIDSFRATDSIVTFGLWALVGVFCLSLFRIIARAYHALQYDQRISSKKFIHPSSFSRWRFWKDVFLDFFGFSAYLVLFCLALYTFAVFILPTGLAYSQAFLLDISWQRIGEFAIGLFILFVGVTILYISAGLLYSKRYLFSYD